MIKLEHLHLHYPILGVASHSLQKQMYYQFKKMVGSTVDTNGPTTYVHALNDINLEIREGQRVGIFGHNGAGKTTLLRVMSGIYTPTAGQAIIEGRVSALTDVTLGMELDASGIKNIIFRLVFMGYTFQQAEAAVEEIVAFSELGAFIHLPIRTYSSGMFMRLAFAISTHFMPDILILDEVIGAGDEGFRLKCQNRLHQLFEQSRIVVLSTHDVNSLKMYCDTVVVMQRGRIMQIGAPDEMVRYATTLLEAEQAAGIGEPA